MCGVHSPNLNSATVKDNVSHEDAQRKYKTQSGSGITFLLSPVQQYSSSNRPCSGFTESTCTCYYIWGGGGESGPEMARPVPTAV